MKEELCMMGHSCNPSYVEGRGRRILVRGQPGKKCKTLFENQTKVIRAGDVAQTTSGRTPASAKP
jgi:hypothetical protein